MKKVILAVLLSFSILSIAQKKTNLDFSSIDKFWNIVSILEKDMEPSKEQWDEVLLTPGYKEFIDHEAQYCWMQSYFRKAFMPSHADTLEYWKTKGYWDLKFPIYFQEVYKKKKEINSFLLKLKNSNYQEESLDLALQYFPKSTEFEQVPPIAFLFFDRDARGYNPILLDALFAMEVDNQKELKYLIAHEIHHYLRNEFLTFKEAPRKSCDADIIWVIDQIHKEGIADQIDKDIMFANPANEKRTNRYQKILTETPQHIIKLDSLLNAFSMNLNSKEISVAIKRAAPNSGHPMGYFMAKTILKYQSHEGLVEDIGNPFVFFYKYQDAALKSEGEKPVFSETSMDVLKALERKYAI